MPLGTEVGLGPNDIVLHGDPAPPPKKRGTAPNFRPMSIVAKRLYAQLDTLTAVTTDDRYMLSPVRLSSVCRP